jgi:hypothetical protein
MAPILYATGDPIEHLAIEISNDLTLSELPHWHLHPTMPSNVQEDEEMDDTTSNGSWQDVSKPDGNQVNFNKYKNCSKEEAKRLRTVLERHNNFNDAAANGDIVGLKKGLESGVKVNRVTARGLTALGMLKKGTTIRLRISSLTALD